MKLLCLYLFIRAIVFSELRIPGDQARPIIIAKIQGPFYQTDTGGQDYIQPFPLSLIGLSPSIQYNSLFECHCETWAQWKQLFQCGEYKNQ